MFFGGMSIVPRPPAQPPRSDSTLHRCRRHRRPPSRSSIRHWSRRSRSRPHRRLSHIARTLRPPTATRVTISKTRLPLLLHRVVRVEIKTRPIFCYRRPKKKSNQSSHQSSKNSACLCRRWSTRGRTPIGATWTLPRPNATRSSWCSRARK